MVQAAFALFVAIALSRVALTRCESPLKPKELETWGNWFKSGWSDEQWNPVIGVNCWGVRCNSLRLLTYNAGIIQGSPYNGDYYDTEVFSDPSNWGGYPTQATCKKDYIVTRVWCDQAFCDILKLRCTKLKRLSWCTRETCDEDHRYWTEILSNEDSKVDRSERKCKKGTVLIGMECIDTYFCDRKRLLCEAITPPVRRVSSWWEFYQTTGSESTDIHSVSQTSEAISEHIFSTEETWSVKGIAKMKGEVKGLVSASLSMSAEYEHKTFEKLESSYSESLKSERIRLCKPQCHGKDKHGFLWMIRVDLVDPSTNTSLETVDPGRFELGFFQTVPGCLVQCVPQGTVPKCPPIYCENADCQCCTEDTKDALSDGFQTCAGIFTSAAVQQHRGCRLLLGLPALLGVFTGLLQFFV